MQNGREFVSVFIILDYYCVYAISEFSKSPIIRSPTVTIEPKKLITPESTGSKEGNNSEERKINIQYPSVQNIQDIPKPKPKIEPKSKSVSITAKEAPKIKSPPGGYNIEFDDILDRSEEHTSALQSHAEI